MARRRLAWKPALVYVHRWLGIILGPLFLTWFTSGIVMMYARMPALAPEERLARLAPLDLSALQVSPAEAQATADLRSGTVSLVMVDGRPAYRFAGAGQPTSATYVFADDGTRRQAVDATRAWRAARIFAPEHDAPASATRLTEPDQWMLQARGQLPAYRFRLDDEAGTEIYVSEASGDVVLRTTRRERLWAYLGPVLHWIYFTPLRRDAALWSNIVIWASIAGCVLAVSGLVWGLIRLLPGRRTAGGRKGRWSPYAGPLKWHHCAGLAFGIVTLTWTFSGLLSMGPWNFLSSPDLAAIRRRAAAPAPPLDTISVADVRRAAARLSSSVSLKELDLMAVERRWYWRAFDAPAAADAASWIEAGLGPRVPRRVLGHLFVAADGTEDPFRHFSEATLRKIAERALPGVGVAADEWLTTFDGYYYDARGQRSLPVLRVRYADEAATWLYLDPSRGEITLAHDRVTRTRRWLYQGLHSLDFPVLYDTRPVWDVVVVALSLGGLFVGLTSASPAGARLFRHARRLGSSRVARSTRTIQLDADRRAAGSLTEP
jgi:hypothetical protein